MPTEHLALVPSRPAKSPAGTTLSAPAQIRAAEQRRFVRMAQDDIGCFVRAMPYSFEEALCVATILNVVTALLLEAGYSVPSWLMLDAPSVVRAHRRGRFLGISSDDVAHAVQGFAMWLDAQSKLDNPRALALFEGVAELYAN